MSKVIWVCVSLLALGSACGDDDGKDATDGGADGAMAGQFSGGDGDSTTSGDGDGADSDAGTPGGDGDGTPGDGDGDGTPGDGDGDGGAAAGNGIPQDGGHLSTCFGNDDCNDGFECYGDAPAAPPLLPTASVGFCTETCDNDKDCSDIGSSVTTCSPNSGQCRIECTGDVDGECPDKMECGGSRCGYPDDAAATKGLWQSCSESRIECRGDRVCVTQDLLGLPNPFSTTGFCADECSETSDCTNDGGRGGTASCVVPVPLMPGNCVVECESDGDCPADLTCSSTGPLSPDVCVAP